MPVLLSRLLDKLKRRVTWALPVELYVVVFLTSWLLMIWAEPDERISDPDVFWYWFLLMTTPGFGEYHPTTNAGYAIGAYVIIGGVVAITMVFTRLAQVINEARGRRMQGRQKVAESGHIVLLGYTAGRTEGIVEAVQSEHAGAVVVCAWEDQATQNPMAYRDNVHFVRGNLTDDDVLARAALPEAAAVLVDPRDGDEALKVTVAVHFVSPEAHTVVALHDLSHARTVSMVAENAWCVQWHAPELITEELLDAGMSQVYTEMMALNERNTYSITVPDTLAHRTFGEFQQALGRWNAATILAVRTASGLELSPSWRTEVPVGATLYYLARRRLATKDLERHVDRAERALVTSERELLRAEWR